MAINFGDVVKRAIAKTGGAPAGEGSYPKSGSGGQGGTAGLMNRARNQLADALPNGATGRIRNAGRAIYPRLEPRPNIGANLNNVGANWEYGDSSYLESLPRQTNGMDIEDMYSAMMADVQRDQALNAAENWLAAAKPKAGKRGIDPAALYRQSDQYNRGGRL